MMELETICPYTGLRSFSEDESLYFKGRDSHIMRVIDQLEQKKFLMVTGASGDGKSSLIFAGLIPQARAGFFKASYSNWHVVSFRPERSPLANMANALASELRMEEPSIVENELSHGFSSLTEIYKSSSLFIDQKDKAWQEASADSRLAMDRGAGNLLVVVDQFEEFFTNPENFPDGVPSQDSRLVLNILLETVKISLRDDLPIYVVFTMRSDYIGQCAAFRGLPEFIGFSQFFVPRLQRKELQQVIEQPAILSGNRISKRLVDRLIFDLEDTEDHLPILQHVLKEIWKAADLGREEMDLLHYAMVGGMPGEKLPKEVLERFQKWEASLSPERREYLRNPGLSNVLDIHATRLYSEAAAAYNKVHETGISEKDAKLIIGITFACLTRIDENRAVRNRMTLEEITRIINIPHITTAVVDNLLRPFRDPEHTLVRPFIQEDSTGKVLSPGTVLDITHEALIRNWKLLNRWAAKEFEYYNTFIDFKKQLQRWIDNGHSSDYLLPIGPLTYFENWFRSCRPNMWWINRYNSTESGAEAKIKESELTLALSKQFLRRSALRLFITKAFMKYGARRISTVVIGIILVIGAGFLIYTRWNRRNDVVVNRILSDGKQLLRAREASSIFKSEFLITAERLRPGFTKEALKDVPDGHQQLGIAIQLPSLIFARDRYSHPALQAESFQIADSLLRSQTAPGLNDPQSVDAYLTDINDLLNVELNYLYFNTDEELKTKFNFHGKLLGKFMYSFLTSADPAIKWQKKSLNIGLAHVLNFHVLSSDSIAALISALSPFEGSATAKKKFDLLFPATETVTVGTNQRIDHNGGYEMLANLYAASGLTDQALRCMDTVLSYNRNYDFNFANSRNVAAYFLLYDHGNAYDMFVNKYAKRKGLKSYEYMRGLVNQAGVFDLYHEVRSIRHGNYNPNLALLSGPYLEKAFEHYEAAVKQDIQDVNERNFALALLMKHHGVVLVKKALERREAPNLARSGELFDQAAVLYGKLPAQFLDQEVEPLLMNVGAGFGKVAIKRSGIFIYPDHLNLVVQDFWIGGCGFYGDAFFNYLRDKGLFQSWYKSAKDYALLNQWVGTSFALKDIVVPFSVFNSTYLNYPSLDHSVFAIIDSMVTRSGFSTQLDNSWVQIKLIRDYLSAGQGSAAIAIVDKLNYDKMTTGRRTFFETITLHNYGTQAAKELVQAGYANRVTPFVYRFKRRENRIVTFSQMGIASFNNGNPAQAAIYLDSVRAEFKRIISITDFNYRSFYDLRNSVVQLLTLVRQQDGRREILDLTGDMGDLKVAGVATWARTFASMGKYYEAESIIPTLANADDRLNLYSQILYMEILRHPAADRVQWLGYDESSSRFFNFILYGFEVF